ncbi:MAG: PBECR2 nuclease fold domain-containing protein [Agriterribacter sp.]
MAFHPSNACRFFRPGPVDITGLLDNLYDNRCPVCGGSKTLPNLAAGPWDDILDKIAETLLNEKVSKGAIHPDLYRKTANDLLKAMHEGIGGSSFAVDDSRNTLKAYLEQNLYAFCAAKSITEMQQYNELLRTANGDFVTFRNALTVAGYQFNIKYLSTEFDTANASAQMAHQWDLLSANNDYLEYSTAHDDKVRPEHAKLDGLTLSKDSPVWKRLWPPLDWGCRCHVVPGIAAKASSDAQAGPMVKQVVTNPLFDFNSGMAKTIFKEDHPYFQHAGEEKTFDAVKNYGLKSIEKLYDDHQFPNRITLAGEDDYKSWWQRQPKHTGSDDIVVTDKLNLKIKFDSVDTHSNKGKPEAYFKDHVLRKTHENRWQYAANFPEIVADPDEVWSVRENNKLIRYYIRYYNDAPYVVVAGDKKGEIVAETVYQLTKARATELRRGALLYAKK